MDLGKQNENVYFSTSQLRLHNVSQSVIFNEYPIYLVVMFHGH